MEINRDNVTRKEDKTENASVRAGIIFLGIFRVLIMFITIMRMKLTSAFFAEQ